MEKCSYGCEKDGIYQLKNGKWCCSISVNLCSAKTNKDSVKKKGINPWAGREHPRGMLGKHPWNYGKHINYGEKISKSLTGKKGHAVSEETKKKMKETIKKNRKTGGYRQGSGRGKKGWYKGVWCDSSWELAWVIYHFDHEISFQRNKEKFAYEWQGEIKYYIPDFIYSDGLYIEIKGYMTEQNKAKIASFVRPLRVLLGKNMKPYLNYVIEKYGKDFIGLYENINYIRKCSVCGGTIGKGKTGMCVRCYNMNKISKKSQKYGLPKNCLKCGIQISRKATVCRKCSTRKRKVIRPFKEELKKMVWSIPTMKIAKQYGVSDNAVAKWCKGYGIEKPPRGYWAKQN